MMQILEKLPGITVERYTLMEKSNTFAGNDSKKLITSQDRPLLSLPPRQHKHRHHSVGVKRNPVSISRDKYAEDKREDLNYRTSSRGEINPPPRPPSSQFINKNSHNYATALLSGESAASENGEVLQPRPPRVMPKSILKRTGSGVSNRSSRSLGVVSLDSGMSKLTDSLMAGKKKRGIKQFIPTESKVFNEIARKHAMNQVIKMNVGNTTSRLHEVEGSNTNLPFLGHTNRTTISFYAQNGEYGNSLPQAVSPSSGERVTAISPSKSVSFKLDDEKPRLQGNKNLGRKKKGAAKWEVVLSSKQKQVSDRSTAADRQEIALKREIHSHSSTDDHNNNTYVFGRTSLYNGFGRHCPSLSDQERKSTKEYVDNAHPSSALLRPRPDGGITGVSGIQLLADPYKRFLLTRSVDPTRGHGKLNNQSKNRLAKSENGNIRTSKQMHKHK